MMPAAATNQLTEHVEAAGVADLTTLWDALEDRSDLPTAAPWNQTEWRGHAENLALTLLRKAQTRKMRRIAVMGIRESCGATTTLTAILWGLRHQKTVRTIAMDMNFRSPNLSRSIGIQSPGDTQRLLSRETQFGNSAARLGLQTAFVGQAEPLEDPLPMLSDLATGALLDQVETFYRPDLYLFDLPALLEHSDILALTPHLDAVLVCAMADKTREDDLERCQERLAGVLPVIGTVLSRSRYA